MRMKQASNASLTAVILCYLLAGLAAVAGVESSQLTVDPLTGPVELEDNSRSNSSSGDGHLLKIIRRELHHQRHQCPVHPDPRSPHLQRRSTCPFDIQRDVNPLRIPDVIHRAHCLCGAGTPHASLCRYKIQPNPSFEMSTLTRVTLCRPRIIRERRQFKVDEARPELRLRKLAVITMCRDGIEPFCHCHCPKIL